MQCHVQTTSGSHNKRKLYFPQSLGGSSPLCAITRITNNIRYTSQTQQTYYGVQGQVNDNMFRPFYSNKAIIRSSKVT